MCGPMGEVLSPKRSELNEILIFRKRRRKKNQSRRREEKRGEDSVDVKLVAEMEEKASRLTGETTGGSKGKVGSRVADRLVGHRVVGKDDALGIERPVEILRRKEITHSAVPIPPP